MLRIKKDDSRRACPVADTRAGGLARPCDRDRRESLASPPVACHVAERPDVTAGRLRGASRRAASTASRSVADGTISRPGTAGGRSPRPAAGTMARPNPSRAASRSRRSRPLTARSSPSRPTSPMATVPTPDGPVAQRRGEGQRERQVHARLVAGQAAGQVRVDVVVAEPDPGPARRGRRAGARAGSGRARSPSAGASRCSTARRAPGPRRGSAGCPPGSARRRCPGAGVSCSTRKARAGSTSSARPPSPISNTPTSSVDPKRFFDGPQEAQASRSARPPGSGPRRRGARGSWGRPASRPSSRGRRGRRRCPRPWRPT